MTTILTYKPEFPGGAVTFNGCHPVIDAVEQTVTVHDEHGTIVQTEDFRRLASVTFEPGV